MIGFFIGFLIKEFDMSKADRFDLEQEIMEMRDIIDNIDLLQIDGPQDKVIKDIIAIKIVHELKWDKLWKTFLEVFELKDGKAEY